MLFAEELSILDPIVQYIFAGLFAVAFAFLIWMLKTLLAERGNDMHELKEKLDEIQGAVGKFPCGQHEQILGRHDRDINGLLDRERNKPGN